MQMINPLATATCVAQAEQTDQEREKEGERGRERVPPTAKLIAAL